MLLLPLAVLSALYSPASALPRSAEQGLTVPLSKRSHPNLLTVDDKAAWAREQADKMRSRYAPGTLGKRASGSNSLVNQNADTSYYGSLAVGTPPKSYDVILDTGSSDLWLAASDCTVGCSTVPTFNGASSSSFKNLTTSFSITYGSGAARGSLVQDTVQMAGFSIPSQTFALCDQISTNLLTSPVSGLLGLGWKAIAASGATPFWQALVQGGSWTDPLMSFVLTRFVNQSAAAEQEPGGVFTMGYLNTSLYTGDIEYTNIPSGSESYWLIPLTAINAQGKNVFSGTANAAIDTGTTLVGGPADAISAIFAQIPGSAPGTGSFDGYYTYPCNTDVIVSLSFGGGKNWTISPSDFELQNIGQGSCVGAFFEINMSGSGSPKWIIGDTFLKNVMSVYRFNPPSVGFATLAPAATALAKEPVPTPTIGANTVSPSNAASSSSRTHAGGLVVSLAIALGGLFL